MRRLGVIKRLCVIGFALAFNQQIRAQVVEIVPGPILETRPDTGTPIAATAQTYSIFSPPRGLRVSVSATGGYDDNVNSSGAGGSGSGSASSYTSENASISYTFGTPRTHVSLTTGGGITDYLDRSDYNPSGYLGLSLNHAVSPRMTLNLSLFASYQSQPDLSTSLGSNQQLGNYLHSTDTISLAYSWFPRFSTVTSYTFDLLEYDSSVGSLLNRTEHTISEEFRYLMWPATSGIAEYRLGIIAYETAPQDSTTHFLLVGLDHSFTPRLNGSFRAGAELRFSENAGFKPGPYFESNLSYLFRHGAVIWTNNYSIEEADTSGASPRPSIRTGLTLNYGFTRRLSGNLALFYVHGGSQISGSSSSSEDTFDIGPSLHCLLTRHLSADAGYHYTKVEGSVLNSYSSNNFFGGLSFTF
jgi:hypothetical protein